MTSDKFSEEEIGVIKNSYDEDFDGITFENDDYSLNIDEFDLYKSNPDYEVYEMGHFLFTGNLMECLKYIHTWL